MPATHLPQALELAISHHRAGRLAEAEAIYRQIVQVYPASADALHLLGVIASQVGKPAAAVEFIGRALQIQPDAPEFHLNLGVAFQEMDRLQEAADAFRRAIQLQRDSPEAHHNVALVLGKLGHLDEACAAFREALALKPRFAEAYENFGALLKRNAQLEEAIEVLQRGSRECPECFPIHASLGEALAEAGRFEDAASALQRAVALQPEHGLALNNLGNMLANCGRLAEAEASYRRALALIPRHALLWNNLANLCKDQGRIEEAISCYRQALELDPSATVIRSNFLVALQYRPGETASTLLAAHCDFDRVHAAALRDARPHPRAGQLCRPLRIGFVSPHFANHPVGSFLVGLLEHLDRVAFYTVAYSDTRTPDSMTERLRTAAADWQETVALSDAQLAEKIRADHIDILFDLAGHTAGNRLLTFARKPAPVQITWLDYVGTTGLSAIDYLIADPREIPSGSESDYREKVLRMPDDYICFAPPTDAPPVGPLPALAAGRVTFGSFNIPAKTSRNAVEVWARVLRLVPESRLILKNRGFEELETSRRILRWFAEEGVASERIEFRGWSPQRELLENYHEVDIALDTLPYNGGLTTCEAMWMGVPVITFPGETFASRHGLAHLTAAGVPETIATSPEHYIALAATYAADLTRLASIRAGLRSRLAASPLCDAARFAQNFSALLHSVWMPRAAGATELS